MSDYNEWLHLLLSQLERIANNWKELERILESLPEAPNYSVKKEFESTLVETEFDCTIANVTDKAVKAIVGNRYAWIPKKCIKNLDKIVLVEGKKANLIVQDWFINKVEWRVII